MNKLTKGEQFVFDWQYNVHEDASFKGYLSKAMAKADSGNLTALSMGFPDEAEAMDNFHHKKGWWSRVEDIGRGQEPFAIYSDKHHPQNNVAKPKE